MAITVGADGILRLTKGDDYATADSRWIAFTVTVDCTAATTITFTARDRDGTSLISTTTVTAPSTTALRLTLTAAQTATLSVGYGTANYWIVAVVGGRSETAANGTIYVQAGPA